LFISPIKNLSLLSNQTILVTSYHSFTFKPHFHKRETKERKPTTQHNTKPNKGNKRERERDWYLEIQSSYGGLTVQQREKRERERENEIQRED
jgi:hypothetical protein